MYEAAPELKEIRAGVALHPNAMRVLRMIGVEDAVRKVAGRSEYLVTCHGKTGRTISKISRAEQAATYGMAGATVQRADLLDVIADALPTGSVTLGKRCATVESHDDTAVARFEDGTEIEADVIIGADGIHSRVRAALFGPDDPRFTGKICHRSVVGMDAITGAKPSTDNAQWLGPHGTIVLYPLRGNQLVNVVAHYDHEHHRHESWINECDREEVLDRYAGWHESLRRATALRAEPENPQRALERYERTRRPRASRVVLAARERGASNHLSSPLVALRRDLGIAVRRRFKKDTEGRGAGWIPEYDATSPEVLASPHPSSKGG